MLSQMHIIYRPLSLRPAATMLPLRACSLTRSPLSAVWKKERTPKELQILTAKDSHPKIISGGDPPSRGGGGGGGRGGGGGGGRGGGPGGGRGGGHHSDHFGDDRSSEFMTRWMSDTGFPYKLKLEFSMLIVCSIMVEVIYRRERLLNEWPVAFIRVLGMAYANRYLVWTLAPSLSSRYLPNNMFERNYYPLVSFDFISRALSFVRTMLLLGRVGGVLGTLECALSLRTRPTTLTPLKTILAFAATFGININLSYHLICGFDTLVVERESAGVAFLLSTLISCVFAMADVCSYSRTYRGIVKFSRIWFGPPSCSVSPLSLPKSIPVLECDDIVGSCTLSQQGLLSPCRARNCFGRAASSSTLVVDGGGDAISSLERCFLAPPDFGPVMKSVQYSAFGTATLEKSELDYTTTMQDQTESSPELFDRKFVDSVLNEWGKVMMDLPAGFRLAYEMGLVSSAEMVEFLATNARPTIARLIARSLPQGLSREFNGRLIADPAFLHRLLLEQATTFGFTLCSEMKNRGESSNYALMQDKAGMASCSDQNTHCDSLQRLLLYQRLLPLKRKLSETIPSAFVHGARFGLSASMRYQLLCGFERLVIDQFDVIGVSLFFCATMRVLNVQLGETWFPLGQSNDNLKAYIRPSEGVSQSSKWFQFKKAIVSASGIKQGQNDDSEAPLPKGRRKRVVKRRVLATI
ncbi:hypothetical protein BUALT_Bualt12G0145000 [Buddleja alternifolia]|uniref:Uncharacterized protein n=1 Tax=Buddleja alternifolia TaxID=168488 RepID=A0AAV6WZS6_9LAMI|nr:hypothetical protein BUALT_Bualt12G0145000 [Buddleja alternifolia]